MKFASQITFIYYKDLAEPSKFYEEIFGFELEIDQGWAKMYRVSESSYLGIVHEKRGHYNWEPKKTVLITFVTDSIEEVDEWYEKLKRHGVKLLTEPKTHEDIGVRGFFLEDPAGYSIEIQYFL